MKANLRLNSSLTLNSIESKARRAAAIAATSRSKAKGRPDSKEAPKKAQRKLPAIEREINSIFLGIERIYAKDHDVKLERPKNQTSCKAIIKVYTKPDPESGEKEPKTLRMYALYPGNYDDRRIGSVAIYGDDAEDTRLQLQSRGNLFGLPIRKVTVELGRRPFVDVTIRL